MPAVQKTMHAALKEDLTAVKSAGHFSLVVLADPRGLAWAVAGDSQAPDQFAAIPALLARAFADRQPLLRFFSQQMMRFEYHSDSLAYIRQGVDGHVASPVYFLDVPSAQDTRDFVVAWSETTYLVIRSLPTQSGDWALLGLTDNPQAARNAFKQGAPALVVRLESVRPESLLGLEGENATDTLHARMLSALEAFQRAVPGIQMAAVTSKDGFVVTSLAGGGMEAEMVAPLLGHSFLAIQESTQQLCGTTEMVLLRMEQGVLMGRELTDGLLFAAILEPDACTGLVFSAFETAAGSIRAALESMSSVIGDPRSLEVAA